MGQGEDGQTPWLDIMVKFRQFSTLISVVATGAVTSRPSVKRRGMTLNRFDSKFSLHDASFDVIPSSDVAELLRDVINGEESGIDCERGYVERSLEALTMMLMILRALRMDGLKDGDGFDVAQEAR